MCKNLSNTNTQKDRYNLECLRGSTHTWTLVYQHSNKYSLDQGQMDKESGFERRPEDPASDPHSILVYHCNYNPSPMITEMR